MTCTFISKLFYSLPANFYTGIHDCTYAGCTSGVSAGQIMPQCVLCSCRGLASFPSRPMGEFSLRRWDSVEAKVRRLSTWETPALVWWAFRWSPQFPVAREYFSPSVMVFVLMASSRLKSWEKRREERGLANTVGKVKLASSPRYLVPRKRPGTRVELEFMGY